MAKKKNVILTPEQEQAATSLGITNLNSQNDLGKIDKYIADQAKKKKAEQGKNQPKAQSDPTSRFQINQGPGKGGGKVTAWNEERSDNQPPPATIGNLPGKGGGRPAKVKDDQFERLGIKPGTDRKDLTEGQKLALTFDNIRNIATSGPQPGGGAGRDGSSLNARTQLLKSGSAFNKGLAVAQKQNPNQKFPQTLPSLGRVVSVNTSNNARPATPAPAPKPTTKPPTPAPTPAPARPTTPTPGPTLKPSTVAPPALQRGPSSVVRDKAPDIRARLSIAQQTGRTKLGTNQLRIGSRSAMSTRKGAPIAGTNRAALALKNRQAFESRFLNQALPSTAAGSALTSPPPQAGPRPARYRTYAPPQPEAVKPTPAKPGAVKPGATPTPAKPAAALATGAAKPGATPTPAKPAAGLATGAAKPKPVPVTNKKQQPRVTGLAAGVARR